MITEIVTFDLPAGMTRQRRLDRHRETAPAWRGNPDLLRKACLHDGERGIGGGVHLRRDRGAVPRWHDGAFVATVERRYGSRPRIRLFGTPVLAANLLGQVLEAAPVR